MNEISIDGFDFTLLKNNEEWTLWSKWLSNVSLPDVFPCLALHIRDADGDHTQIYLPLGDLEKAVALLKTVSPS